MIRQITLGIFTAIAVLLLAIVPDGQKTADATDIFACVNNNSGRLKIVSQGTSCSRNETVTHWPTVDTDTLGSLVCSEGQTVLFAGGQWVCDPPAPPASGLAELQGPWQMTFTGVTGCGQSTSVVNFTLDSTGKGMATIRSHTSGCGDPVGSGYPFQIKSLNADGSGTANLSCGPSCGWELVIQVSRSNEAFSVVDVDPANPGNYVQGIAIRQGTVALPADRLVQLQGPWQMTFTGVTGCGQSTSVVNFTLDSTGKGMATIRSHTSGCGDPVGSGYPFQIKSLNADGSGTANLSCGPSCGWELVIQVSKSNDVFSVVDVAPVNPGNYVQGVAIRQ